MSAKMVQERPGDGSLPGIEERLRLALVAGGIGIWELALDDGYRISLSKELQAILGLDSGDFLEDKAKLLEKFYPQHRRMLLRAFTNAIRHGTNLELELHFRRGESAGWLLARGRFISDGGRPARLIGVGIDITAQKSAQHEIEVLHADLERRVTERTLQLEAATKELETFCYSVSHDLRAPLRSIRGFNELLMERYSSKLDSRGQDFLRRASQSGHQMEAFIGGLVKLSRVGRAELVRRTVNLSEVANSIAKTLQLSEPARCTSFEIEPGLTAWGDEPLLHILLENLLHNSWKFTSKQAAARIEFGFTAAPEKAFFVRDDGVGFEPAYADRLFGAFQRLHAGSEFDGCGTGLAIVQRIINRHGGRVWAAGSVNRGATFYFVLPDNEVI
jgi:signal transduction histidine kinase